MTTNDVKPWYMGDDEELTETLRESDEEEKAKREWLARKLAEAVNTDYLDQVLIQFWVSICVSNIMSGSFCGPDIIFF